MFQFLDGDLALLSDFVQGHFRVALHKPVDLTDLSQGFLVADGTQRSLDTLEDTSAFGTIGNGHEKTSRTVIGLGFGAQTLKAEVAQRLWGVCMEQGLDVGQKGRMQ